MTTSAIVRGWGNPDAPGFRDRNIVVVRAAGIALPVHRGVADVFVCLLHGLDEHYDLSGYADDWGYCNRCVRGTGPGTGKPAVKSNHSWGLAGDLDASVNPMTTNLQARHQFVRAVVDPILKPFGGRLLWGGEYSGHRKDYMHFEYVGTPAQAAVDSATARRLLKPAPARKAVVTQHGDRWLGLYDPQLEGNDVQGVQRALELAGFHVGQDAVYGLSTARGLAGFQAAHDIDERGCGPKTWAALRVVHGVHA